MSRHGRRRRGDPVAPWATGSTAPRRPPAPSDGPDGNPADDDAADAHPADVAEYGVRAFAAADFGAGYFATDDFATDDHGDETDGPADAPHEDLRYEDYRYGDFRYGDLPRPGRLRGDRGPDRRGRSDGGAGEPRHGPIQEPGWRVGDEQQHTGEDDGPWQDAEPAWDAGAAAQDRVGRGGTGRRSTARTAAQVLTADLAERVKPDPLEGTEMWAAVVGTVVWVGLFVVSLVMHSTLSSSGRGWWTYTCVAGIGVGLLGVHQIRRRRTAGVLRSAAAPDDERTTRSESGD